MILILPPNTSVIFFGTRFTPIFFVTRLIFKTVLSFFSAPDFLA
jgi:hypothetical protein